tara:strand:+ start:148 stop:501 length:354 start_codon:yes stop_codon:yes gene_type:complete
MYIAKVFGKTSPKISIRVPLSKIAKTKPFWPNAVTNIAVDKEVNPIFTSKFPKTIAESRRVGLFRRIFTCLPLGYRSQRRRNFKLLKEKMAVSEAEKKADKLIKIIKRKILNSIFYW